MEPMQLAIEKATQGILACEGGPFGACIVKEEKIVAVANNTVLLNKDPTAHAEVNVIRLASKILETHILEGCTLYTTAEPCPMCLAAIYWAHIEKVVIGVTKEWVEEFGFSDLFLYEEFQLPWKERKIPIISSPLSKECGHVFEKWRALEGTLY